MSQLEAQKRVFSKWVLLNLSQSKEDLPDLHEDNFGEAFQDGSLLLSLVETLSQNKASIKPPKSSNKLQVMGFITEVVQFVEAQNMRLTISAENIYAKDETMILGLIWMLVLKYQVGKKAEILEWLRVLLEGESINNFDSDWRNGLLFCKLVNALGGGDSVPDDVTQRLEYAFSTADEKLGIREILSPSDVVAGYFDERSCLTYLSFFYNKYKHVGKKVEPPKVESPDPALLARIKELEDLCEKKDEMLNKSQAEIDSILKTMKAMGRELEEQKETNEMNEQAINELQLKIPFMNQKAPVNAMPAPSGSDVSLVVFDVEDAEGCWNRNANDTAAALQVMQATVREKAKKYGAFEAETVNEKMVFALSDSGAALAFAAESQQDLNELEWPETYTEGREDFYKGLPSVTAVHTGTCAYLDGTYSGPAVRVTNRLISAARGGEILTTQASWENCESKEDSEAILNSIARNELGNYEVKEIGAPIDILQLFPESLKQRSSLYKEFEFLTPDEKQQMELKDKLAKLQEDNDSLKVKLEATEAQAKKARDRALELNKWLAESRSELRTTVGEQIQAAMAEVASLIRESEELESDLTKTKKQLTGAKKVMDSMNSKIKQLSQRNALLGSQVTNYEREQIKFVEEIEHLEEELAGLTKKPKKRLLYKILPSLKPPSKDQKGPTASHGKQAGAPGEKAQTRSKTDPDSKNSKLTKSKKDVTPEPLQSSTTEPLPSSDDAVSQSSKKRSLKSSKSKGEVTAEVPADTEKPKSKKELKKSKSKKDQVQAKAEPKEEKKEQTDKEETKKEESPEVEPKKTDKSKKDKKSKSKKDQEAQEEPKEEKKEQTDKEETKKEESPETEPKKAEKTKKDKKSKSKKEETPEPVPEEAKKEGKKNLRKSKSKSKVDKSKKAKESED